MEIMHYVLLIIFSLSIGSFLNVVIYRFPLMLQQRWREQCLDFLKQTPEPVSSAFDLCFPRSHCPHCKKTLKWYDNIPVFSFLILRGKCRYCQQKIHWQYPLVELLGAILAVLAAWKFGFTGLLVAALVFSWSLLVLFFIDLQHQILPDEITLSILWLGLLFNIYGFFTTLQNAVVGAMVGYVTLWLIGWLFKKIRGIEGIGYGDYKLFALCGAWLGWQSLPLILVIASSAGLVYGVVLLLRKKIQRQTPFAFGTFLALAAWIIMFFGNYFIR